MAKKASKSTKRCLECGGTMHFGPKQDTLTYKGHDKTITSEGWWCEDCGEGILEAEALQRSEAAFMQLKAEVDGLLLPAQIVEIRKLLRLSQRRAGELLGGGPRAFQKYESGDVWVSVAMSNLLRLLAKDPKRLVEITNVTPDSRRRAQSDGSA